MGWSNSLRRSRLVLVKGGMMMSEKLRFSTLFLILFTTTISAEIPLQVNHQGVISVGGSSFNGTGLFRFALVDPDTNENRWTNDGSGLGTNAISRGKLDRTYYSW